MVAMRWVTQTNTSTGAQTPKPWILWLFLLIGLAAMGGAAYLTLDTRRFLSAAIAAPGEVIDLIEVRDSDNGSVYRPRVRFQLQDGKSFEFTSTTGSNPAAFDVGEAVEVLYEPARPTGARINTLFQLWFAPILLAVLGLAFAMFGGFGLSFLRSGQATAGAAPAPMAQPAFEPAQPTAPELATAASPMTASSDRVVERTSRD